MKILHAPFNVAGQASVIARAQQQLGHTSDVMVFNDSYLHYEYNRNLQIAGRPALGKILTYLYEYIRDIASYDIFHFHFGSSLLPGNLDLSLYPYLKKKTFMHYWGSDVIQTDVAQSYTLWDSALQYEIYPSHDNNRRRQKLLKIEKRANATIVGDFSLLPYSPRSIVVRQAFDTQSVAYVRSRPTSSEVTILHAPTNRGVKGTRHIESTIAQLKKKYPVKYQRVEGVPHTQALKKYASADIIVDDVLQGPYGILAIECMALGKPVLARIDKKLIHYYPGLPIVNANPDNLTVHLKKLITQPELRRQLGKAGRQYVEQHHEARIIAKQLTDIYTQY